MSLRARLILLAVITVVPLLAFDIDREYRDYRAAVANTGQQTLKLARSISQVVERELNTGINVLEVLARSRTLATGDLTGFRTLWEATVALQFPGATIVLLREDGQELINTTLAPDARLPTRSNLDTTRQVFATSRPGISSLYLSAATGQPVVAIDVPVMQPDRSVAYVLSLNPRLAVFVEIIRRQQLSDGWLISVFDRDGVNVARTPNPERFVGARASPGLLEHLSNEQEGVLENTSREGIRLVTAFSHSEPSGWAVAIGVPRTELVAPILASAMGELMADGTVLLVGLTLAFVVAQQITRPIGALRRLAASPDRDLLLDSVSTGLHETDEVAQALLEAVKRRAQSEALQQSAHRALGDSEARLRAVTDNSVDGLITIRADGTVLTFSRPAERIFGYRAEEVIGENVKMLMPEPFHGQHDGYLAAYLRTGAAKIIGKGREVVGRRKDGSTFAMDLGVGEVPGMDGGGREFVGSVRDITDRVAAQAEVRRSQALFEATLQASPHGVVIRDTELKVLFWNRAAEEITGYAAAEVVGTDRPRDAGFEAVAARAAAGETIRGIEEERRRKDGAMVQIRGTIAPIYIAGKLIGLVGMMEDVTARNVLERQLVQAQKMEAIGNLTGGMAHDFNNLLGVIVGNLDLALRRVASDGELREIIDEAREAAWRGADLTRGLLAFARRQPLRPVRIDINELVANTVKFLSRLLREDIAISLELGENIWRVTADPSQLEATLANLAANARDAMPGGGRLIIKTANRRLDADYAATRVDATEGDFVLIEVSDTGTGMSAEILSQVFEPFFTTKEPGKGTGLGLSMVFGFLRQSGGHVSVYSEPGCGTTFRLYLPRATTEDSPREIYAERPVEHGHGETVLVIEDNLALRRVVLRQLRELGYRVLEADHADAGLELLRSEAVDLLLSDVVMPGGTDGVQLARLVQDHWPKIKIVLTSGFPEARIGGDAGLLKGVELLSKPYRIEELSAALRRSLDT